MAAPIDIEITNDYFGGIDGIKSILNDYYENELDLLEAEEQDKARVFIEEGLIVGGKRVLVSEGVEKQNYDIEPDLLKKLLDSRIVREENTHLGKSYEVSHDTLVAPILESLEKRMVIKEREEAQRRLLEQEARLNAERKKRRRITMIAVGVFALFVFSVIQTIIANQATTEAELRKNEAVKAKNEIIEITADLEKQKLATDSIKYFKYINSGKSEMEAGNYQAAIKEFQFALDIKADRPEADSLIRLSQNLAGLKDNFNDIFASAQQAFDNRSYLLAITNVIKAENMEVDVLSKQKLQNLRDKTISAMYAEVKDRIKSASVFHEKGNDCRVAQQEIKAAEQLLKYLDINKLRDEMNVINRIKQDCN